METPWYRSNASRKLVVVALIGGWMIGFFLTLPSFHWTVFIPLAALVLVHMFEQVYSITVSSKTSEFFKAFIFQTAVPLAALVAVCIMAVTKAVEGTSVVTMFALSLAYTTYVVGKKIKGEPLRPSDEDDEGTNKSSEAVP